MLAVLLVLILLCLEVNTLLRPILALTGRVSDAFQRHVGAPSSKEPGTSIMDVAPCMDDYWQEQGTSEGLQRISEANRKHGRQTKDKLEAQRQAAKVGRRVLGWLNADWSPVCRYKAYVWRLGLHRKVMSRRLVKVGWLGQPSVQKMSSCFLIHT